MRLLDQVRHVIRKKHYSICTEQAYTDWIKRFILFHGKKHPKDMGESEISQYISYLAVEKCCCKHPKSSAQCNCFSL